MLRRSEKCGCGSSFRPKFCASSCRVQGFSFWHPKKCLETTFSVCRFWSWVLILAILLNMFGSTNAHVGSHQILGFFSSDMWFFSIWSQIDVHSAMALNALWLAGVDQQRLHQYRCWLLQSAAVPLLTVAVYRCSLPLLTAADRCWPPAATKYLTTVSFSADRALPKNCRPVKFYRCKLQQFRAVTTQRTFLT